ncbi:MAG TPA: hypothetical protein VN777_14230 [Terriglobales bacterium]|nr:hypothetical protein [Terriglobales bacterium]
MRMSFKAFVKELAKETPRLRHPEDVFVVRRDGCTQLAKRGGHISQCGESQSSYRRVLGRVGNLVGLARHKTASQVQGRSVRDDLPVGCSSKLPLIAKDHARRVVNVLHYGQNSIGAIEVHRRIRRGIGVQVQSLRGHVHCKGCHHAFRDRLPVLHRDRQIDANVIATARNAEVPAHPNDRIALRQQQAVAKLGLVLRRAGRVSAGHSHVVEKFKQGLHAAIGHLEKCH